MHFFLRRAALFLVPVIVLLIALYVFDHWFSFQQELKMRPPVTASKIEKDTKKGTGKIEIGVAKDGIRPSSTTNKPESLPVIMLDPAHGGDDIGNIGYKSAVESNLDLQFSFKLARALRMKGFKVYLTRMEDKNVPLEHRFDAAKSKNTALYLSINCAYSDIKTIKGMEIYGFTPAQSDEDETEKNMNGFYDIYEGVYLTKTPEAMSVENKISLAVKEELGLPYKSRLERKFLKPLALSANIPTLILYIGYISNEDDAKMLSNEKYVDRITEKIAAAVEKGLTKKAPLTKASMDYIYSSSYARMAER